VLYDFERSLRFSAMQSWIISIFNYKQPVYMLASRFLSAITLLLMCNSLVLAQKEAIVTDRPDQSATPVLVLPGALQVETGLSMESDNAGGNKLINLTYNNTLMKYGVNKNFELRLAGSYLRSTVGGHERGDATGVGPVGLGTKVRLADEKGLLPQTSIVGEVNFVKDQTEDDEVKAYPDVTLACTHTLSRRGSLTYNFILAWNADYDRMFAYTLSYGFQFNDKLGSFIELYGFLREDLQPDHRMDFGFTFRATPVIQVDCSGGVGLRELSPDYFLSAGISARMFR
jgi:hypothetical protein